MSSENRHGEGQAMQATKVRPGGLAAAADAVIDEELVDRLVAQADGNGVALLGPDGLLSELTRRLLERGLEVELSDHLAIWAASGAIQPGGGRATPVTSRPPRRF
jgi:hypothetical protein